MAALPGKTQSKLHGGWILDLRASYQITACKDILEVNTIRKKNVEVKISDGSILTYQMMGNAKLNLDDYGDTKLIVTNVLYIPAATAKLTLVNQLNQDGGSVTFVPSGCFVKRGSNTYHAQSKVGNYYTLRAKVKILHQRLGHIDADRIRRMDLPYKTAQPCEACMTCKQLEARHCPKHYEYKPLDLVYMDAIGPILPKTPKEAHIYCQD